MVWTYGKLSFFFKYTISKCLLFISGKRVGLTAKVKKTVK